MGAKEKEDIQIITKNHTQRNFKIQKETLLFLPVCNNTLFHNRANSSNE